MTEAPVLGDPGDLEIVFVDLDAAGTLLDAEEAAVPRLSPSEIERAAAGSDPETRRRWRWARIATRIVLERRLGQVIRRAQFRIAPGGRPELAERTPAFERVAFSISHSGSAALIAVGSVGRVGVDIEQVRDLAMSAERRRRVIASAARLAPGQELSTNSAADVLNAWVRLEAIAKARGTGIGRLLTEEGVIGGGRQPDDAPNAAPIFVDAVSVPAGYVAAVAADVPPEAIRCITFPASASALADFLTSGAGSRACSEDRARA